MIVFTSFGYLHGGPPADSDLVLDARHLIRDPHVDPALRQLTGRDYMVMRAVMDTPGATALVDFLQQAAELADVGGRADIRVAVGCQGGRHRSVVLVESAADAVADNDFLVRVIHRDIDKPVVVR